MEQVPGPSKKMYADVQPSSSDNNRRSELVDIYSLDKRSIARVLRQAVNEYQFMRYTDAGDREVKNGDRLILSGTAGCTYGFSQPFGNHYAFDKEGTPIIPLCPVLGCDDSKYTKGLCTVHHPMFQDNHDMDMESFPRGIDTETPVGLLFQNGIITPTEIEHLFQVMYAFFGVKTKADLATAIGKHGFIDKRFGVTVVRYKQHSLSLSVMNRPGTVEFETCGGRDCYRIGLLGDGQQMCCSEACRKNTAGPLTWMSFNSQIKTAVREYVRRTSKPIGELTSDDFLDLARQLWKMGRAGVPFELLQTNGSSCTSVLHMTESGGVFLVKVLSSGTSRIMHICQRLLCMARISAKEIRCSSCAKIGYALNLEEVANGKEYECDADWMVSVHPGGERIS